MFRKHWIIITIIILILIGGSFLVNKFFLGTSQNTGENVNVGRLYKVSRGNLEETISVSGYINPVNEREVSFQARNSDTRDTVETIKIDEGDPVKKGDILIVLDKTKEKLDYLQAENEYKKAKINGSKNEIKEAKINLQMAEEDLAATELKAPITGIVTNIQVEEGDNVSGGTAAVNIIDNSRYEVEVDVPEGDVSRIKLGLKARATLDALSGQEISGEVVEIDQEAEENSGVVTIPVNILLAEGDFALKPGYSADVEIIVSFVKDKIIVPITAIYNKNGQTYVSKYEEGQLKQVPVTTGINNGLKISIESGLEAGDRIVINAFQFAQPPDQSGGSENDEQQQRRGGPSMMGGSMGGGR